MRPVLIHLLSHIVFDWKFGVGCKTNCLTISMNLMTFSLVNHFAVVLTLRQHNSKIWNVTKASKRTSLLDLTRQLLKLDFQYELRSTISNSIMHCTVDCRGKKGSHLSLITSPIEMHIKMNLLKNCTGWSIMASEGLPFSLFKTIPVLCDNYFSVKYLNMNPVLSHFFGWFISKKIKQMDIT